MPSAPTERKRRDEGRVCALERGNEGSGRAGVRSIRPWSGLDGGTERCSLDTAHRIDNNLVENAVRPLALGRKNFLFCGNHDTAARAAIVYSLVDSCNALPSILVNGWRMSCSGYQGTRTTGNPSVDSCPTSEQNKQCRINLPSCLQLEIKSTSRL